MIAWLTGLATVHRGCKVESSVVGGLGTTTGYIFSVLGGRTTGEVAKLQPPNPHAELATYLCNSLYQVAVATFYDD